ncbi:hypothetical protein EON83_21000 [bacterium]|nr:MAG: hypothetical protein EON83_21000 [bacterium]
MQFAEQLPEELKRRLAVARAQVEQDEVLPLRFRYIMSILAMFGPRWHVPDSEQESEGWKEAEGEVFAAPIRGWQRRAWNALLCAEKVAPQWDSQLIPIAADLWRPEEIEGLHSTDLGQIIQEGKFAVRNVLPSLIRYAVPFPEEQTVMDVASSVGYRNRLLNRAAFTYRAVEYARWVVCHDEDHEFNMDEKYSLHWSGDWTGILSVDYSSSAFSIEIYDREFVKDQKRLKEFWLWWIDEAVPASWFLRDL